MKRIIILTVFALMTLVSAHGQDKIYCELLGTQTLLSKKIDVQIDFGQQTEQFAENGLLDENGQGIVFNTLIDAMNHMSSQGWMFEQAYFVSIGSGALAINLHHWLLSKPVEKKDNKNIE